MGSPAVSAYDSKLTDSSMLKMLSEHGDEKHMKETYLDASVSKKLAVGNLQKF